MQVQADTVLKRYISERAAKNYKARFYANDDNVVIQSYSSKYETAYFVVSLGF